MKEKQGVNRETEPIDFKVKVQVIITQTFMILGLIGSMYLYSTGNKYIVSNTVNGLNLGFLFMILGIIIGFSITYQVGQKIDRIRFNYFPKTVGLWLLFVPLILTTYTGYVLNLKLTEKEPKQIEKVILGKSGDFVSQNYRIIIEYNGTKEKVSIPKKRWMKSKINDSISLSVIKGYFGFDIIRYD
jgi:hypothetical protein